MTAEGPTRVEVRMQALRAAATAAGEMRGLNRTERVWFVLYLAREFEAWLRADTEPASQSGAAEDKP